MVWKVIDRPGFLGIKRSEVYNRLNEEYHHSNWRLAWHWGDIFVTLPSAQEFYELSYYEYLKNNPPILEKLLTFSDVIVNDPSDVLRGHDYNKEMAMCIDPKTRTNYPTHLQDVALRKAVMFLGEKFKGTENLKVSWHEEKDSFGYNLNPGIVPFYRPDMILPFVFEGNSVRDYGAPFPVRNSGSIEAFYQHNKVIQLRVN